MELGGPVNRHAYVLKFVSGMTALTADSESLKIPVLPERVFTLSMKGSKGC